MAESNIRPSEPATEVRCGCGSLMARVTARGLELKCRRCKRVVLLARISERRGWTALPPCEEVP